MTMARYGKPALLLLAASDDAPLSADDVENLLTEAAMLSRFVESADIASRRRFLAEIGLLVRRLDPSDERVASFVAFLAGHGVAPAPAPAPEPTEPSPTPAEPAPVEPPSAPRVAPTVEDIAAAQEALEAARALASERREAHAAAVEERAKAKARARETNAPDDWSAYHHADRVVLQGEELADHAEGEATRLEHVRNELVRADAEARFDAALRACDDDAVAELLGEAVGLQAQCIALGEAIWQHVLRATHEQNRRADAAFAAGRALDLSEQEVANRMRRAVYANNAAPRRSIQAVVAMCGRLAQEALARGAARPAEVEAERSAAE